MVVMANVLSELRSEGFNGPIRSEATEHGQVLVFESEAERNDAYSILEDSEDYNPIKVGPNAIALNGQRSSNEEDEEDLEEGDDIPNMDDLIGDTSIL